MKFARLRLSGFKSFVEPTDLVIEPGLTGVVGPNGCGKSNLLEALRWVMGENSYKNMRASGMDDVIFSGTTHRPARNMAEVTVTLDNSGRTAPAAFNELETIEVSRRIEREAGSAYRINGKDVRARDVQLLFADASTGARSPALVRQGQIGELISAKPQARRRILEEAAGITGLHTRRHEAELKLKGAEQNLQRLDDVIGQLESQLSGLKRQARQAQRYKQISADLRRFEAAGLYTAWMEAREAVTREAGQLDEITRLLAENTRAVSELTRAREEAADGLPALREQEMVRAAVLQRLTIERQTLDQDEARAKARVDEVNARLAQTQRDLAREQETLSDTAGVITRLAGEEAELSEADQRAAELRAEAAVALQAAAASLAQSQEQADAANAALSELTARRNALARSLEDQAGRMARIGRELADVQAKRQELLAREGGSEQGQHLSEALDASTATAEAAEAAATEAEVAVRSARQAEANERQTFEDLRRKADALTTEVRTLGKLLHAPAGDLWPPLVDALTVEPGFEMALGAALGDDIDAPADEAAPIHWRGLPPLPETTALPAGARRLSEVVTAPPALARRLEHTGIVDRALGAALQNQLKPGQRLVSVDGDLWRWDGFTAAAEAPTAAARRLAERNRLATLEVEATEAEAAAEAARARFDMARAASETATQRERERREDWRAATSAVEVARRALAQHERAMAERLQQASALDEAARRLEAGLSEAKAAHDAAQGELSGLADTDGLTAELQQLRDVVTRERAAYGEARARHDGFEREAQQRDQRLKAIAGERTQWMARSERAQGQITELSQRAEEAEAELASLADLPQQFADKRGKLLSALSEAEAERQQAADALAAAEADLRAAEAKLREAQELLGSTREEHARCGARVEAAHERHAESERRISEALNCAPDEVIATAGLDADNMPPADEIERKVTQLRDERERLGGVNLMAEEESEQVRVQLETLVSERDDLIQAIAKLRGGIQSLNKEGRQRLLDAFEKVNTHFGELFTTLFNGGKAELQLIESDDPLEAGLEILAHPPGKKPTVLSLLSGGEQALTAMALIFAVFVTNPSPICVLDEVDAPLDDHNVERFCNMLDAMLERTETRFLVITHHALTMARMNRLFGVTMMERGCSQLVSVDLERANQILETAAA